MKKILLIIFAFIFLITDIKALEDSFYYNEFVSDIKISRTQNGKTSIGKVALIKRKSDNKFVYCVEPFQLVDTEGMYPGYSSAQGLMESEIVNKINLIGHYGYMYSNHTDLKWYAITQFLIWEALGLDDIYFADLAGNKISIYDEEISELNNLVNTHLKLPSMNNNTYEFLVGKTYELVDENNVLDNYTIKSEGINIEKKRNKLLIKATEVGTYKIHFEKKGSSNNFVIYAKDKDQNLVETGSINNITGEFIINVKKGKLTVNKVDSETETSQGDATLSKAQYQIFDIDNNLVDTLETNEFGIIETQLPYGKYTLKEITPSKGYLLDENIYEFIIDDNNKEVFLKVKEMVIKNEIIINKTYGENNDFKPEENIIFEVYQQNKLYDKYITNENGYIKITLPYGVYTIKQVNTTNGYTLSKPFNVEVLENNLIQTFDIKDYKEENLTPPNTGVNFMIVGEYISNYLVKIIKTVINCI